MSYALRDLPLPVKVVASTFLLAVGLGYGSAMVQLHMQDSKSGKPMPTVEDVIKKYTGKVKYDPNNPPKQPVSKLEELITCPTEEISSTSMSGAFKVPDAMQRGRAAQQIAELKAQRKGEQAVLCVWIKTPDAQRKQTYDEDRFVPPQGKMPADLTPGFKADNAVKIRSLINTRCAGCHGPDGDKKEYPLDSYEGLAVYLPKDPERTGDWVKVEEPISTTKLTQSTHAHLLSFAVLFSLTGLIFAFSSYPTWVRCIVGPWVVIALVADISLWWAARLSNEWGPYFAMGILGTGGLAGLGLSAQITLSLFNMYSWKGKAVLALMFALGAAGAGTLYVTKLEPAIKDKLKANAEKDKDTDKDKKDHPPIGQEPPVGAAFGGVGKHATAGSATNGGTTDTLVSLGSAVVAGMQKTEGPPLVGGKPTSKLDRLVSWPPVDAAGEPIAMPEWNGEAEGNMAAAFFEKDKEYKELMAKGGPQAAGLKADREGEAAIFQAWTRTPEAARKKAYEDDAFPIPKELAGKPISAKFVKNGKVQIKALIGARCVVCHGPDGKQSDFPLTTYEELHFYLTEPATASAGGDAVRAPESPAPEPPPAPRRSPVVLPGLALLAGKDD